MSNTKPAEGEKDEQRLTHVPVQAISQRPDRHRLAVVHQTRSGTSQPGAGHLDGGARLGQRRLPLQARHDLEVVRPVLARRVELEERPERGDVRIAKLLRHDADHRVQHRVERDRAAEDFRARPEAVLAERVAEDDEPRPSREVFGIAERTPERRLHTHHVEERRRDQRAWHPFGNARRNEAERRSKVCTRATSAKT